VSKYPCFLYHPIKPAFICPSEEFLLSLKDHDEYEFEPFTGPRAIKDKKYEPKACSECLKLKLKNNQLEQDKEELKSEIDRLRIAIKMNQKDIKKDAAKSKSEKIKAAWAKRKEKAKVGV